jgi:hypothetical protein
MKPRQGIVRWGLELWMRLWRRGCETSELDAGKLRRLWTEGAKNTAVDGTPNEAVRTQRRISNSIIGKERRAPEFDSVKLRGKLWYRVRGGLFSVPHPSPVLTGSPVRAATRCVDR